MPETVTSGDAQYALGIVKKVCTEIGPGLPGTSQERGRAEIIKEALESHLGAENVHLEEFTIAPRVFHGVLRVCALFILVAVLLYLSTGYIKGVSPWVIAVSSFIFTSIATLIVFFETILYREFIDPLVKKEQSVNVIGALRKPGTQNVKRLLILSGHHDSALEFTWLGLLGNLKRRACPANHAGSDRENTWLLALGYVFLCLTVTMFIGYVAMLLLNVVQLVGLIFSLPGLVRPGILGWVVLVYPILPSIILGLTYVRGWKGGGNVPGAADNLSASAVAVAMCRFLVKNPEYIPGDTEIRFISFGSEEEALRGSRRYVERHLDELKRLDARVLNFEVVAYPEIGILATDVTGVKNDPGMVKSVVAAAVRAGVPYDLKANPTSGGGSDAGPFSQAGIKALTLMPMRMPHQLIEFYHQKWDGPDVLTIEPLVNTMKLVFEWVRCAGE